MLWHVPQFMFVYGINIKGCCGSVCGFNQH